MTRKELTADIKKRVAAGESKCAIFSGNLNSAGARIGIVLFGLAINVAVLVGVIRYSGIAYMITSILIPQSFAKILEAAGKMNFAFDLPTAIFVANASFAFVAFALGLVLHRLMLPCTTFFFTVKKTAMGQPVFED